MGWLQKIALHMYNQMPVADRETQTKYQINKIIETMANIVSQAHENKSRKSTLASSLTYARTIRYTYRRVSSPSSPSSSAESFSK